jgi:hypothetical protein
MNLLVTTRWPQVGPHRADADRSRFVLTDGGAGAVQADPLRIIGTPKTQGNTLCPVIAARNIGQGDSAGKRNRQTSGSAEHVKS